MEKQMFIQFLKNLLDDMENNNRDVGIMVNKIEQDVFKAMTTLHSIPISIGIQYFEISGFDNLRYSFTIEYKDNEYILNDKYFNGIEYVYYESYIDNRLYRISVYFDKDENKYMDLIDVSFFGECPEWLNDYKDNVLDILYK